MLNVPRLPNFPPFRLLALPVFASYCPPTILVMKRRYLYGLLTVILTINLVVGATVYLQSAESKKDTAYPSLELFSRVMEIVRRDYVDGKDLKYQDLVRSALKGMLDDLDPHSEFMEPAKFHDLQSDTEGKFGGIGVVVSLKDGKLTVVAPMEDTPGFRAGIRTGDVIEKINGKNTEKFSVQDAVKVLRGDPDTEVTITVFTPSTKTTKEHTLKTRGDQGGHGEGHQRQAGISNRRKQDWLFAHHAVRREDVGGTGGGAEKVEGAGDARADH